ncbi:transglycosylase SLT domain-containing protein [Inquilinus sp. CA228]|uniref:lytic transglycosylase domain-containing protein n=1 Tax=Inquilinus sp. CA228 TaxID=3455609 RepID=UPI003F8D3C32
MRAGKQTALAAAAALLLINTAPALAQPATPAEIKAAQALFFAVDRNAWDVVRTVETQMASTLVGRLATWADLSRPDSTAGFEELAAFVVRSPDWPNVQALRRRAERTMPDGLPADAVVAWFDAFAPLTAEGALHFGTALQTVDPIRARIWARDTWRGIALTGAQETEFLGSFGNLLNADDHWARLDALLWAERTDEARRMLSRISGDRRLVADARLKLMARTPDASAALRALPAKLLQDEGILYERARWRRRNDDEAGAIEMLGQQPKTSAHAKAWWLERHIIARRLFDEQSYRRAYQLVTAREQSDPVDRAERDFLAGWLALRFLDRPDDAVGHFETLYADVSMPISLARGAYWAGRAHEAAGHKQKAADWYRTAAKQPLTFYGQLAADKLDQPSIAALPVSATPSTQAVDSYGGDLARAARLLDAVGQRDRADLFLRKLMVDADTAEKNRLLATLATSMQYPFVAVRAGKAAAREGLTVIDAAYPLVPLPDDLSGLPPALVLGLARQESEFNATAVSSAGAIGLMQLLPGTARDVSRALGIDHTTGMLSGDPVHNLRLGSRYLADLIRRYDGNWPRAIAAYNAGFGRVDTWAPTPSKTPEQVVDWIESIPLPETRSYVQRVLENTQVYRLRLGEAPKAGALEADLLR